MSTFSWILPVAIVGAAALAVSAWAQTGGPDQAQIEGVLPLEEIVDRIEARYAGRIINVEIDSGRGNERASIVYEIRLLTGRSNVLKIRLDATTGDFLEVDGRGLIEARRGDGFPERAENDGK